LVITNITHPDPVLVGGDPKLVETVTLTPVPMELKLEELPTPGEPVELKAENPPAPVMDVKELKIVIIVRGATSHVGIQQTGCDPIFFTDLEGGVTRVLERLNDNINLCVQRWLKNSRNPKVVVPEKPAQTAPAASTSPAAPTSAPRPAPAPRPAYVAPAAKPKIQPSMF
jgi:hypothetical protein